MITEIQNLDIEHSLCFTDKVIYEESVFFDIETTGFSPKSSFVYLIGAAYYHEQQWNLIQWLCESPSEECKLLEAFILFMKDYKVLFHFNGDKFDIPFLIKRCEYHSLSYPFHEIQSIDFYRTFRVLKKLFHLSSLTLKSFEEFLLIQRTDQMDGGSLISVFHSYCRSLSTSAKELLLLHNHDDLKGTVSLLSLYSYLYFLKGEFDVTSSPKTKITNDCILLTFYFTLPSPVPLPVSCRLSTGSLSLKDQMGVFCINGIRDTLKYFFSDYQNYYYLPLEDTAIHKSVASFVEQKHRLPAKAATCFCKKSGYFLPGLYPETIPQFKYDYHDTSVYFEYNEVLFSDKTKAREYLITLFNELLPYRPA